MLLSLPRPQIIQNRGDGHAAFDEGAGVAFLVDNGHGYVGRVIVDIKADEAAEDGPDADTFAEGGFALDTDFREAARDGDVGGMALDHGGAEFINLSVNILHHKGGRVVSHRHLDRAADGREGMGTDARYRVSPEMEVGQLGLGGNGYKHHYQDAYHRLK